MQAPAPACKRENQRRFSSQYKGVHWRPDTERWVARLTRTPAAGLKNIILGTFLDEKWAALAWDAEARRRGRPDKDLNFSRLRPSATEIARWTAKHRNRKAVEQLCLETGAILKVFPSVIAAAASVNAHLTGLDGGHATQGFFWRLQGSTATYDPTTKRRKCVEQLSLDTGEVLQVFPSKAAAAASVKIGTCPFSEMSMDKGKVTQGFFWRLQGSTATPATHIAKTLCGRKAVEKISLETGAAGVPVKERCRSLRWSFRQFLGSSKYGQKNCHAGLLLAVPRVSSHFYTSHIKDPEACRSALPQEWCCSPALQLYC